jgi:hypothetical protein
VTHEDAFCCDACDRSGLCSGGLRRRCHEAGDEDSKMEKTDKMDKKTDTMSKTSDKIKKSDGMMDKKDTMMKKDEMTK